MQWATNHVMQDESSYSIDGGTFRNYDGQGHGTVSAYDALRQSFNIPALKAWQQVSSSAGKDAPKDFASKVGLDYEIDLGPSEILGGGASEFSPTQLASAFASIANGGTYNNAHSIRKVVTSDDETIEFDHTSHKAMEDYTAYMLAEMLTGTFKPYGSAYGHGVAGVNMGAKTGTSTYGTEVNNQYNLPDNAAKDIWMNGFTPKYTMSIWMGFSQIKPGGEDSFLGHSEQEYPQYLYKDVMSDITSSNDGDFKNLIQLLVQVQVHYQLKIIRIIIQLQEVNMIICLLTIQIVAHQVILVVQEIVQAILILPVITTQILHQQRTQVIQLITQQIIQLRTTVLTIVPH